MDDVLLDESVELDPTSIKFVGNTPAETTGGAVPAYDFSANLADAVNLTGGERYWFSVRADTTNGFGVKSGSSWRWAGGAGTSTEQALQRNPTALSYSGGAASRIAPLYYVLDSTLVPEPAGLTLLGAASLGLLARRRRAAL
jgi:hypothetical protein